ncbi:MAG: kynureninase [Sphingomonas sp.]
MMDLATATARDAADPLRHFRDKFVLPEGVIYLDGNSLGPLPKASIAAMTHITERQWGDRMVRAWNEGWMAAPQRIGAKIARLIGAEAHEVIVTDSTSSNLFKLLVAALNRDPTRRTIVTEAGNFPSDLYVAEGAARCVPGARLLTVARGDLLGALSSDTAVILLTHVHYKTSEAFDMMWYSSAAHAAGALVLWDLSHSTGAIPVDLGAADADLAVGCGYKYLNGGPGAPAYLYVNSKWQDVLLSPLSGWLGHAEPFAFVDPYRPAPGIRRWLNGSPPMLAMAALESGVDLALQADIGALSGKSAELFDCFAGIGDALQLECVSPRAAALRGSHISFRHQHAYALSQALIDRGVIGDFRAPDIIRFGLTPLYLGYTDVVRAGDILRDVLAQAAWQDPRFAVQAAVT